MKCVFCDAELKKGCLFCPTCGKDVQIVPDYNEFDDEYINGLVGGDLDYENSLRKKEQKKKATQKRKAQEIERKNKIRKKIILFSIIATVVILITTVVIAIAVIKNNQNNSVDYQVKKAHEAIDNGDLHSAISYYDRALVLEASNCTVLSELAEIYKKMKDYKSALSIYNQILNIDPDNKMVVQNMIELYDSNKEYDSIITLYSSLNNKEKYRDLFAKYFAEDPKIDVYSGKYKDVLKVNIISSDQETIYYTLNGKDPRQYGMRYDKAIEFNDEGEYEIQAVCVNDYGIYSDVVTRKYVIAYDVPNMPIVSPDGGSYISETYVSIDVPKGCSVYYLWGSSRPNTSSTKYKKPFKVPEGNNILSAIAIDNKTGKCSEIYRGRFECYIE